MNSISDRFDRFLKAAMKWAYIEQSPNTKRLVRLTIFSWLLLNTLILLPEAAEFWSPNAYIPLSIFDSQNLTHWYGRLILHPLVQDHYELFVAGQIAACLFGIFGRWPRIAAILIHFFTTNLWNKQWVTLDGGCNLIEILIVYLFFMDSSAKRKTSYLTPLSNLALLMIKLQVLCVYVTAGWAKLNGEMWRSGMALYYILQADQYTHPIIGKFLVDNPLLSNLGTYFTLAFQISFPFLVWNKRTRFFSLIAGVLLHSQIMLVMGLPMFGLAMIISYTAFFDDTWSKKILSFVSPRRKIHAAFDHQCGICMKFARLVARCDVNGRLRIDRADNPKYFRLRDIPQEERLSSLHVYDENEARIYKGWNAVAKILTVIPLISLSYPLFALIDKIGLGKLIYSKISHSHGRRRCHEGSCELMESQ